MSGKQITASKSALLLGPCSRWAHPAAEWFQESASVAKDRDDGKEIHAALKMEALGLPWSVRSDLESKVKHGAEYLTKLKQECSLLLPEVPMGLNFQTGEAVLLTITEDRAYPEDGLFYGTADLICVRNDGKLLVADWKTGPLGDGAHEQLKTLAVMAQRLFKDNGQHREVVISPLMLSDDGLFIQEFPLGAQELSAHAELIYHALVEARIGSRPSLPVVGPHCTTLYCPHLAHCPSTEQSAVELQESHHGVSFNCTWTEIPTGMEHAGMMAARLKAIQRAHKYYEGCLKDWIRLGNKAKWNGYEYKETGRGFMLVREK